MTVNLPLPPHAAQTGGQNRGFTMVKTLRLPALLLSSATLLLAACNSPEEAVPSPILPSPNPAPLLSTDPEPLTQGGYSAPSTGTEPVPLAPGNWQTSINATGIGASFVSPEGKGLLTITCNMAAKSLTLAVANRSPGNQTFILKSGGAAARLTTTADNNLVDPHQWAAVAPQTGVFEGFVHSGGSIEILHAGGMALRLPSDSNIRPVFEACQP